MRTGIAGLLVVTLVGGGLVDRAQGAPEAPKADPERIPAPDDVAQPPADAQWTKSGLAYKVLVVGQGGDRPSEWDTVTVHYTGWTTDGKMFDSSRVRNTTATFPLNRLIPGWTEGLQLMSVGEQTRFWIPEELAYKGQAGKPAGMLVFDVELISITPGPKPVPAPPDVAAPPKKAKKTKSGVPYVVVAQGHAKTKKEKAKPTDHVIVSYTIWTSDGKMVESTTMNGRPKELGIDTLRPTELMELVTGMTRGERRRAWFPASLFEETAPQEGALRVVEIEVFDIIDFSAPADVAAPPNDAQTTASGLASKVLRRGTGVDHPTATSTVEVHYTGWTTDGKMFDSSYLRSSTLKFRLTQVIPGWTEGVQLMTVGEKRRLWIPEELAYKGRKGAPQGMLVFDVELVSFTDTP